MMVNGEQLRLFFERLDRLEDEKKGISDDIRDVYSEAKSQGYDSKIMRQLQKLRRMEPNDRQEMEAILEVYKDALGMGFRGTAMGQYADSLDESRGAA